MHDISTQLGLGGEQMAHVAKVLDGVSDGLASAISSAGESSTGSMPTSPG